jgi:rSAM/selenodomain-associated transferase 2
VKVSVIIPALNEEPNVGRAIDSAWTAGADEVIVSDGGSKDDTVERSAGATSVVTSEPGRARQMNSGAKAATGGVLVFLHADNWLQASSFDQLQSSLEDQRVVGGSFRQRIEAAGFGYRWLEWGNAFRASWLRLPYGDQGIFVRRGQFDDLGGFPEVALMEDVLLVRSLRKRGRLVSLDGPIHISARRWQEHGILRQTLRNWWILTMHRWGVAPDKLAIYYRRHDK